MRRCRLGDGSAFFFGGDNLVADYLSGAIQHAGSGDYSIHPDAQCLVPDLGALPMPCRAAPWTAGEISDVEESTFGAYARVDFGTNFGCKYHAER